MKDLHYKAVPKQKVQIQKRALPVREVKEVRKVIDQAFLPKNSIIPDPERSLVSLEFDNSNRLVATFDDGKTITTRPISVEENIENHVSLLQTVAGSSSPADIDVQFVTSDYNITDDNDILIVTSDATVYLPVSSNKTFRIKRYQNATATIQPQNGQEIQFSSGFLPNLILNADGYSVDLHQDPNDDWSVL